MKRNIFRIHPDLKYLVLCTAIHKASDSSVRDTVTSFYEHSDDVNERRILEAALQCTHNTQLLTK